MPDKPVSAVEYTPELAALVRATCLFVATKVGDLRDDLVVVGGLVPSLIIHQRELGDGDEVHVGTVDLDVGLTVALLDEGRYTTLTDRLRRAGFSPDQNEEGNPTRQRWKIHGSEKVTVDFLIPPTRADDRGGKLRDIERDFAAVIAPGLHLAFLDRRLVTISGRTIMGEDATREVWVCGPGSFIVLKALAFDLRGENKDAYDLYYVLRNFGNGVSDVAENVRALLPDSEAAKAMDILRRDFLEHNSLGPRRVAEFLTNSEDDEIRADVVGFVSELIRGVEGV